MKNTILFIFGVVAALCAIDSHATFKGSNLTIQRRLTNVYNPAADDPIYVNEVRDVTQKYWGTCFGNECNWADGGILVALSDGYCDPGARGEGFRVASSLSPAFPGDFNGVDIFGFRWTDASGVTGAQTIVGLEITARGTSLSFVVPFAHFERITFTSDSISADFSGLNSREENMDLCIRPILSDPREPSESAGSRASNLLRIILPAIRLNEPVPANKN